MSRLILMLVAWVVLIGAMAPGVVSAQSAPVQDNTGKITSGSIPSNGGFGIIVYGGGTYSQLVTASGCPISRVVFWTAVNGELITFIPGSAVAAPNAGFAAAFPNSTIPAGTPFIGRCIPVTGQGIEGTVTIGPMCGPQPMPMPQPQGGMILPCADQPYQATLVFLDAQGRETSRTVSDANGRYRVGLTAGLYTIVPLNPSSPYPRASSVTAMVSANAYTVVDIAFDSGIRSAQ